MKSQYDVFISCRREGGIDTARTFYDRVTAMGCRASFGIETLRDFKRPKPGMLPLGQPPTAFVDLMGK